MNHPAGPGKLGAYGYAKVLTGHRRGQETAEGAGVLAGEIGTQFLKPVAEQTYCGIFNCRARACACDAARQRECQ
jgi:hypothetical protein